MNLLTSGIGTATVAKVLAEKINEGAAPMDRVSSKALKERVRYSEGLKSQSEKIKHQPQAPEISDDVVCRNLRVDESGNTFFCY